MTIFSNLANAVAGIREDRLMMMAGSLLGGSFSPSLTYIENKLLAAEKDAERRLRVQFTPMQVFAGEPTQEEIDALDGGRWEEESAYDYEPTLWTSEDWGYMALRKIPVQAVQSMAFIYPTQTIFNLPLEWLRLDKKAGHVRIVPTSLTAGTIPLFMLSAMSGGRILPGMIHIRYTAGLRNAETDYPDLVDLIKKMAVLRIVQDQFLPQSGSISADGLSQTLSVDMQAYHDGVDGALDTLFQSLHGPVMTVL